MAEDRKSTCKIREHKIVMNSATKILDIAERRMRQTGYNAVSYRDIAAEMGIKSASLHYHFPKKVDLGTTLVRRYAEKFRNHLELETQAISEPEPRLLAFIDIYRKALKQDQLVCLCAVLGAEAPGLPPEVTSEVKAFFDDNISWLTLTYSQLGLSNPKPRAQATLSALEGAMIVASVNEDIGIFEATAQILATA